MHIDESAGRDYEAERSKQGGKRVLEQMKESHTTHGMKGERKLGEVDACKGGRWESGKEEEQQK